MGKGARDWQVLPHGPIEKLEPNLWRVVGDLPGMPLKRTMSVARLADSRLVIHSAIAMQESAMAELEAWGTPAFLLVPNGWHRLDAARYKARYPSLTVLSPPGARKSVSAAVELDGRYADFPADADLRLEVIDGVKGREGVLKVSCEGRLTLIFNDLVFNVPAQRGLFWRVYGLIGSTGGPRVTPLAKLSLVADRRAVRAHLESLAAAPGLARVVPGHGDLIEDDPRGVLRAMAAGLG